MPVYETEIEDHGEWGPIYPRSVTLGNGLLKIGMKSWTRNRVQEMLKQGHGRFTCGYNYRWHRKGSDIYFSHDGVTRKFPAALLRRIERWAKRKEGVGAQ